MAARWKRAWLKYGLGYWSISKPDFVDGMVNEKSPSRKSQIHKRRLMTRQARRTSGQSSQQTVSYRLRPIGEVVGCPDTLPMKPAKCSSCLGEKMPKDLARLVCAASYRKAEF
jgi:hypothetical protein